MRWRDMITLIKLGEVTTNENGFEERSEESSREVFADRKSVGYAEFYASEQAGMRAELKFIIRGLEYDSETIVEYEGRRYRVLRTYELNGGELIELTLVAYTEE